MRHWLNSRPRQRRAGAPLGAPFLAHRGPTAAASRSATTATSFSSTRGSRSSTPRIVRPISRSGTRPPLGDDLQRRDLQLPRDPGGARAPGRCASARNSDTEVVLARLRLAARAHRSNASSACSRSRSGTRKRAKSSSHATRWASSRCTTSSGTGLFAAASEVRPLLAHPCTRDRD